MADSDYANTALIVKPVGADTALSLRSKHNAHCLDSIHFGDDTSFSTRQGDSSRECTPFVPRPSELELLLKLNPGPKDCTKGFVFGSDQTQCDVHLQVNRRYGISQQHFRIDFNWSSGTMRVNNMSSTNGTAIKSPSVVNGFLLLKDQDMYSLHPTQQFKIQVGRLLFEVCFPVRSEPSQRQYDMIWEEYRRIHRDDAPRVDTLVLEPRKEITDFMQPRKGRYTSYILFDEIGTGQFGHVCKASETITGTEFAAKRFIKPGWKTKAYSEIAISQKITHVSAAPHALS